MTATVKLDGLDYAEGSPEHLEKIDRMHTAEIAQLTNAHARDITERTDLEDRSRVLNEELKDGVGQKAAALADSNEAIQESEDRFLRLVKGVKDYALYALDATGNVAGDKASKAPRGLPNKKSIAGARGRRSRGARQ